jgi:hypothetical protein
MTKYSRRQFLARLGAASTFVLSGGGSLLSRVFAATDETRPFEFLVVGDSLVWGGGLREEQKFYTLTRDWLQTEVFANKRPVNMKNKSHSGATLTLHADEAAALAKAGQDEGKYYPPEVNVSFPSAKKQIEMAAVEYGQGNLGNVDLIMLTGGLTDISTAGILNPNGDNDQLKRDIEKYCYGSMLEVLTRAGEFFPNAMIAVVGYFPILSPKTDTSRLFNGMLEAYGFPRFLKPLANNAIMRPLFFKKMKKKAMVRSRIWAADSDLHLQAAVNKFNAELKRPRAVFIKGPVTEDNCFETPNTLLIRMGKKGRVDDFLYDERKPQCREALPRLKKETGIDFPVRFCELASIGHPNAEGSKAYAESIKVVLKPILERKTVN